MTRIRRNIGIATVVLLVVAFAGTARAQDDDFQEWLQGLRAEALAAGISSVTLDTAFHGVAPIPRVIELDRRQPEFTMTFREYLARVAAPSRVAEGRRKLAENRALLQAIGRDYGVPPKVLVALWGIETNFGRTTGGFPVIAALATLAYDGRRSAYFRKELLFALRILEEGHISAAAMMGSWAGAMGQNQFMPSSFVRHAVDRDGDGRRDIWGSRADVLASAANYLAKSGWRRGYIWGRAVVLPAGFDAALADLKVKKPLAEWQRLGLRKPGGADLPAAGLTASVILPDGSGGPAYLVYDNFRVIMRWNRSIYFATTVGILADRIGDG